jgi:phenylpropionate dioxygenase-like ring-hydroxylating dioxygenase large terminal subunit
MAHGDGTSGTAPGRFDRLVRPDGMVHRTLFTDPMIFQEEMVRIFGGSWVFLLHEAEIPKAGDFRTLTIGLRPVIAIRTEDGAISALLNRCTHRGSMICVAEKGNAPQFQCPYHGWTFNGRGDLVSVPLPGGYGPSFDKKARRLGRFPRVENYRGFVFGSLNAEVEPLTEWLGPARGVLDWAIDRDTVGRGGLTVVKSTSMTYKGNWKLQNDNNGDMYHVPFTHQSTARMNQARYGSGKTLDHFRGDNSPMLVQYFGHGHKLLDQRPAIGSAWERARPVPGREAHAAAVVEKVGANRARELLELTGRSGINLVLYPNLAVFGHGSFAVYEPLAVDLTKVQYYTVLLDDAPSDLNALRLRFYEDFNNVGARDDNEIFERIQTALTTIPEVQWLDFSRGLGTAREATGPDGAISGNVSDETGIRGSYTWWKELMGRTAKLPIGGAA